jgi:hypothetical protein
MKFPFFPVLFLFVFAVSFWGNTADARLFPRPVKQYYGPEQSLLAKNSLDGWVSLAGNAPNPAWSVKDGVLHLKGKGSDIRTERQYKNFVLDFTWSIAKGGNSGVKYRLQKFGNDWLGLEYQIIDDFNSGEGKRYKHEASSLYDIKQAALSKELKQHNEVNHGSVIVNGNRIQHFLNGKRTVDITVGSAEWKELVAKSKFNGVKGFGENPAGFLFVQNHGAEVWLQKITIREIHTQAKNHYLLRRR